MNAIIGVTGGIAAYKAADLVSGLKKKGIVCHVIMTEHAKKFISPLTFESLSGNPVAVGMFDVKPHWEIEHISLAQKADVFVVVPATANVIGKLAGGIADDMLTTTAMACRSPLIVAPAMNTAMYESAAVQHNLAVLRERGVIVIEPDSGMLACGDVGKGKLAPVNVIEEVILFELERRHLAATASETAAFFRGKKVLVTAGPTVEPLDPVRYITNRSGGKMGYAFAAAAAKLSAKVVLVSGPTRLDTPYMVERVDVRTTKEMSDQCLRHSDADVVIMAAAPADFSAAYVSEQKLKLKDGGERTVSMEFQVNPDILAELGRRKRSGQILLGFAAETENGYDHAWRKMQKKNADYILLNDVTLPGAGFDVDTNIATLLSADGARRDFERMPKKEMAERVLKILAGTME